MIFLAKREPPVPGTPLNLIVRIPHPGGNSLGGPQIKNLEKEDPPLKTTPKIDLGSFGVLGLEITPPYPLSVFQGGGFLQSNYRKKEKSKMIKERFVTKTFQKKTYFFHWQESPSSPSRTKERRKEISLVLFFATEIPTRSVAAANCAPFMGHSTVTFESFRTALRSGVSCQENKKCRVKIHPQRKKDPTSGQRNKSDPRQKYLCEPARNPREIETCHKSGGLWRRFCRMGTSFLIIFFNLVSNKND